MIRNLLGTAQKRLISAALAMIPLLFSTACTERPRIVLPPPELATCADEPQAPDLPPRDGTDARQMERDRLMLDGYLALRSAYGDCRSKVDGLKAWRETAGE